MLFYEIFQWITFLFFGALAIFGAFTSNFWQGQYVGFVIMYILKEKELDLVEILSVLPPHFFQGGTFGPSKPYPIENLKLTIELLENRSFIELVDGKYRLTNASRSML